MKILSLLVLVQMMLLPPLSFAETENETVTLDAVGTIGYRDDAYFTVILKPDFGKGGDQEIGFAKTDDLQLAPMQSWSEITPGLAVRVTYEEVRVPQRALTGRLETAYAAVLERCAVKLVVGQKLERKSLAS